MARRTTPRLLVNFPFLNMTIDQFIQWAMSSRDNITSDPDMTSPVVPMATVTTHINDLQATVTQRVTDKSQPLTELQASQANALYNDFSFLGGQIETIANQKILAAGGDLTVGQAFVTGLNFTFKNSGIRHGQIFEVASVEFPGKVSLRCPVTGKDEVYVWRFTRTPYDQNSWSAPVQTRVAKINYTELMGDTRYYFQFAVVANPGKNNSVDATNPGYNWSDPISALVPGINP